MTTDTPDGVALVTGAARGIGAATVQALLDTGWAVVATDSCADDPALAYSLADRADLDAVAARGGPRCVTAVADVRDQSQLDDSVALAVERFGRLDAAIAVAGVLAGGAEAWRTPESEWNVQLDVNLTGVWRLARAAVPALLDEKTHPDDVHPTHRSFLAVSSAAGVHGLPMLSAYAASKHGVVGLMTSMAAELGPLGINVNTICPGSTRTPILDASAAVYGLVGVDDFTMHHLLSRLLDPEEIADTIAFLCGPGGRGITGAVIPVDAGMGAT